MKTNIALFLATLAILAGAAELCARFLAPKETMLPDVTEVQGTLPEERMLFFRYHPILGYDGIPGTKRDFWLKRVTLNSRGERSPETAIAKPKGKNRVLLLGDSEVWGFGASDSETIGAYLQQAAAAEIISLGNIGYSIDQQLLKFLIDGLQYSPDAVVVFFFGDNDLWELAFNSAWNVPKPRFVMRGGELCLTDVPVPRASGWPDAALESIFKQNRNGSGFLSRSALWTRLASRQIRPGVVSFLGSFTAIRSPESAKEIAARLEQYLPCIHWQASAEPPLDQRQRPAMYLRILAELQKAAQANGAKLYLAAVPRKSDFEADKTDPDYSAVLQGAAALGLEAADLSALPAAASSRAAIYEYHGHTSPLGNRMLAGAVAEMLKDYSCR